MRDRSNPRRVTALAATTLLWIASGHPFAPAAMSAGPAVQITSKDDGKSARLVVGQELEVRLEARPGTGYQWAAAQQLAFLKFEGAGFEGGGLPGGREVQVLHFRATSAGEGSLVLHYMRPWVKGASPERVFTLSVTAAQR